MSLVPESGARRWPHSAALLRQELSAFPGMSSVGRLPSSSQEVVSCPFLDVGSSVAQACLVVSTNAVGSPETNKLPKDSLYIMFSQFEVGRLCPPCAL